MTRRILVIGAGAAGLMAAIHAAGPGREVMVVERSADGGRKILISGGGRCNVLPSEVDERRFVTESSPNTFRKILRSWPLSEQRRFFQHTLGIPLEREADTGKLFPASNRARDVRDGLVAHARERGVRFRFAASAEDVERTGAGWRVGLAEGNALEADRVIVAAGGLSVPKTGSDGTGLRLLKQLGHTVHTLYPALTPLTLDPPRFADLAGVSLDVAIDAAGSGRTRTGSGGFLFTHRGYSGPSVLDVSHVAVRARLENGSAQLRVRWTAEGAEAWERRLLETPAGNVGPMVREALPSRLADRLLAEAGVPADRALARLRKEERRRLVDALTAFPLPWSGDEGYRKAEVTGGGVALSEVDPRTLESRLHPGLFLCGELLDVFGPIGGYNFLWAWATGRAAGRGAASA